MSTVNSIKKKAKKRINSPLARAKHKMRQTYSKEGRDVVFLSGQHEKMSDVLARFIEPYEDFAETDTAYRTLLAAGALAWNLALIPDDERERVLANVLSKMNSESLARTTREFVMVLVRRKLAHFADNKRCIADYELSDAGDRRHLTVLSTLDLDSGTELP